MCAHHSKPLNGLQVNSRTVFIVSLSALALAVFAVLSFSFSGCGNNSTNALTPSANGNVKKNPLPDSRQLDLKTTWETKGGSQQKVLTALSNRVNELESYLRSCTLGDTLSPSWVAGDLRVSSINRSKMTAAYTGERIRIARWRPSADTSVVTGKAAVYKAVQINYSPWLVADNIKVAVQLFETRIEGSRITAMLLVEVFGNPTETTGRSATSIWETNWRIDDFRENVSLAGINVKGQEEILNYTAGGVIFKDCTGWIMRNNKTYQDQLGHSLDYWAKQIPGIDIRGDHGIAVADINRDGLDDIYYCQPAGLPNQLFIQNPDGSVDEVAEAMGLAILDHSTGALIVDLNNDRSQDIVISTEKGLLLYSQTPGGKFQLEKQIKVGRDGGSISAADFDQDGDLDLFLCKYNPPLGQYSDLFPRPTSLHNARDGGRNVMLRNDEVWKFTDVTPHVGLEKSNGLRSRSAVWLDYDLDGDQDLYITNEFNRDSLFQNNDGWFREVNESKKMLRIAKHRTVSVGELNGDGRPDIFVGSDVPMAAHQLVKSLSKKDQKEIAGAILSESLVWYSQKENYISYTFPKPIFSCQSANSSVTADLNNDGLEDLIVTNGLYSRPNQDTVESLFYRNIFDFKVEPDSDQEDGRKLLLSDTYRQLSDLCRDGYSYAGGQSNRCYLNIGTAGFSNFSQMSGLDFIEDSKAIARTDWDHDGDIDIVMSSRNAPQLRILINQLKSTNKFVSFTLSGTVSNRDAIGSRIEVYVAGKAAPMVKYVSAASGYLSQSSRKILFGLGDKQAIERVVVWWPNGEKQEYSGVKPNASYKIVEGRTEPAEISNDRFQLVAIEQLPPRIALDGDNVTRSVFTNPFALPILEYQAAENEYISVEPTGDRSMILLFFNGGTESEVLLRKFANSASKFEGKDVDILGLYVNRQSDSASEDIHLAQRAVDGSEFPFNWGTAAPSTITKLQFLLGDWFYQRNVEDLPFMFMVDSDSKIRVYFGSEDVTTDQVLEDLSLSRAESSLLRGSDIQNSGEWISRYRYSKYRRLISVFQKLGFQDDARRYAIQSAPEVASELAHFAMELHSNGDMVEAKTQFENAIVADPGCVDAFIGQGRLLLDASKVEAPDSRSKLRKQALENFQQALQLDPLNTEAIIGQADAAFAQGNTDMALKQLKDYLQIVPKRYEVHAMIGRLHYVKSRTPGLPAEEAAEERRQAASYLNTVFENRPTLPHVAGDLGALLLYNTQYGSARELLRLATKIQPSEILFKQNLGEAEFQGKNFDRSADLMKEVMAAVPADLRPKQMLAWLYATCPYESYRDGKEGLRLAEVLLDIIGEKSAMTLEIVAACHAENQNFDEAVKYQEMAYKLVDTRQGKEKYTPEQIKGLNARIGLYQRKRPYRTEDVKQIPVAAPNPMM